MGQRKNEKQDISEDQNKVEVLTWFLRREWGLVAKGDSSNEVLLDKVPWYHILDVANRAWLSSFVLASDSSFSTWKNRSSLKVFVGNTLSDDMV